MAGTAIKTGTVVKIHSFKTVEFITAMNQKSVMDLIKELHLNRESVFIPEYMSAFLSIAPTRPVVTKGDVFLEKVEVKTLAQSTTMTYSVGRAITRMQIL